MTKVLVGICAALFICAAANAASDGFESPGTLSAKAVLPNNLLAGPLYTIDDRVENDGYLNTYVLSSKYGTFRVTGNALLAVRLNELRAIAEVDKYSTSKAFSDAVKRSGKTALLAPVRVAQTAVSADPGQTAAAAKDGGVQRIFSWTSGKGSDSDAAAQQAYAGTEEDEGRVPAKDAASRSLNSAKELGLDPTRYNARVREWYRKLKVDPYTTNAVLVDKVAYVARLENAAGLDFRFVSRGGAVGVIGDVLNWYTRAEQLALYEDPDKLELANRNKLKEAEIPEQAIDALMANGSFSPGWRTFFIEGVSGLKGVEGLAELVEAASQINDEQGAIYYARTSTTLATVHRLKSRFVSLVTGARIPSGMTGDGLVVVPLAVDHLLWTGETADVLRRYRERLSSKREPKAAEVQISGTASPRAREEIQKLGIVAVRERVQMSGMR